MVITGDHGLAAAFARWYTTGRAECSRVHHTMSDESFLTTEQVLGLLKINLRTVYRLIEAGKLPAIRVGRQWRFRKKDIDAWVAAHGTGKNTTERPRILVLDDEPAVRTLVAKTLAACDYDVETAEDGPAALERIRNASYDLLITDLKMPGMDGLTVVREVRRQSDLPIVIEAATIEQSVLFSANPLDDIKLDMFGVAGLNRAVWAVRVPMGVT